jgi:hypothetical protein
MHHKENASLQFGRSNLRLDLFRLPVNEEARCALFFPELNLPPGNYGVHIIFDIRDYPIEHHLCYMRSSSDQPLDKLPFLRFSDMTFSRKPSGMAVGPWPGWRGVPDMPDVRLTINDKISVCRFNFWGDERKRHILRCIAYIDLSGTGEITLSWEDARFRPISAEFYPCPSKRIASIPTELPDKQSKAYPRLLFSEDHIESLRKRQFHSHRHIWDKITSLIEDDRAHDFKVTPQSKTPQGPERLSLQDRAVLSSFHALISHDDVSIRRGIDSYKRLLAAALEPDDEPMTIDTQAGETLYSICVCHDWLHNYLSASERSEIERSVFKVADRVWQFLDNDRNDYAQAHFLGCSHGLLAFAFLFANKHEKALEWISWLRGAFEYVLKMLPDDGYYPHGINLWIYEHAFLYRYLEMFRRNADIDYWNASAYWENASLFRQVSLSPDIAHGITFGDPQFHVGGDAWMHYLIAAHTGSASAQNLGDLLRDRPTEGIDFRSVTPRRRVWEYIYYDPDIPNHGADLRKTWFDDGGQLFIRDEVDSDEALITFRSGAPLGRTRYQAGEWSGYGHSDPGNGSFYVYKNMSFVISGPGPVYRRDTRLHNTVTIDGYGQIGDGMVWAPEFIPWDRIPYITKYESNDTYCMVETDLSRSYLDFIGIEKMVRRFIYIRPGALLIYDRIELGSTKNIEWNIHSRGDFKRIADHPYSRFEITAGSSSAAMTCLLPANPDWNSGTDIFVPAYPNAGDRNRHLQLIRKDSTAFFLILIDLGAHPVEYELTTDASGVDWRKLRLLRHEKEVVLDNRS